MSFLSFNMSKVVLAELARTQFATQPAKYNGSSIILLLLLLLLVQIARNSSVGNGVFEQVSMPVSSATASRKSLSGSG
jgi:hypothetical protein